MLRIVVLVGSIAALLAAAFWAWSDERARPIVVTQRVTATIAARHAGATGHVVAPAWLRINLPSGRLVDVSIRDVLSRCREKGFGCRPAIEVLAGDVDAVDQAIRTPRLEEIQPIVLAESANSARSGYVVRPLLGSLEVRYAVVRGAAMTYLNAADLRAMGQTRDGLAAAAVTRVQKRPSPRALPDGDGVFRVEDSGDPASNLLDGPRMSAIGAIVGAEPLACGIPSRGRLLVSDAREDARAALAERLARGKHESPGDPARAGVFPCDLAKGG